MNIYESLETLVTQHTNSEEDAHHVITHIREYYDDKREEKSLTPLEKWMLIEWEMIEKWKV